MQDSLPLCTAITLPCTLIRSSFPNTPLLGRLYQGVYLHSVFTVFSTRLASAR